MTFGNDRKELRKGEKLTVTVEEVLHNTLLVLLEYRKAKFCGVLLNTTNRRGPYGIEDKPDDAYYRSFGIDPAKVAAGDEDEVKKSKDIVPSKFPRTLDTRTTYGQKIKQPPPREIYMRRRRSKRKVRMDMMDTDLALKLVATNSGRKMLSHPPTCCCDTCAAGGLKKLSDEKLKSKRKLLTDGKKEEIMKEEEWTDGLKAISKESKRIKLDKKADVTEPKPPKTEIVNQHLKRSPVIKISYKSPGGKGRVLKIPSRLHSPTSLTKNMDHYPKRSAMHERARKVVIRAKTEHYKYLKGNRTAPKNSDKSKKWEVSFNDVSANNNDSVSAPPSEGYSTSKRKSTLPRKLFTALSTTIVLPSQSSNDRSYDKKLSEDKGGDKELILNGKKESYLQKKRQLRKWTPRVLLEPLEKSDDSTDVAEHCDKATALVKSVKVKDDDDDDFINNLTPTSSGPKKRENSKASHSISVTRCTTKEGVQWCQGDVVWAKIMGFPWWPGILRRIIVKKAEKTIEQVAIVDWFQSKTVSHIPCSALESFSGNFKKRYSKRIRGNYKKAIQEAREAEKKMSPEVRKLIMQFET